MLIKELLLLSLDCALLLCFLNSSTRCLCVLRTHSLALCRYWKRHPQKSWFVWSFLHHYDGKINVFIFPYFWCGVVQKCQSNFIKIPRMEMSLCPCKSLLLLLMSCLEKKNPPVGHNHSNISPYKHYGMASFHKLQT